MTAQVLDLGRMPYSQALDLQRELALRRSRDEAPDTLLLVEHDHVITLGRKTTSPNLGPQPIPVFAVERGGDATYHGPGQLVGYPVLFLADHDVRKHVKTIEAALTRTVARFGIPAGAVDGHPGIWVEGKKLASIGVAVTNWVSYHGFALNVNTDMSYFELIRPCGLDPRAMTSMELLLGRKVPLPEVKKAVIEEFSSASGTEFVGTTAQALSGSANIK